jgi:hypothetical protein
MPAIAREEMLALADLNLATYLRHATTQARGGALEEHDGLIVYPGWHPNPDSSSSCRRSAGQERQGRNRRLRAAQGGGRPGSAAD